MPIIFSKSSFISCIVGLKDIQKGTLLGAFLLARIAEIKYFRVNIVACIFSLLILVFVKNDMVNLICIGAVGFFASSVFSIIYSMALQARPEKQTRFPV